ncbi:MAG: YggU family protein [Epsilonproteobacteria bacterium]|nr:YggU family protein [Campylobacterota bacterium]NPA56459.1 YggU family protein [Campylobacterota bacterium]
MWYKKERGGVTLSIRVQPRASSTKIVGLLGESLKITLTAPPVDGAANKELVGFLSKLLKVPKSEVEIVHGAHGRVKVVRLPMTERVQEFIREIDEGKSL